MDAQSLQTLLANPVTFGILISLIAEQTSFFQDAKRNDLAKILIIIGASLVWAFVAALFSATGLPTTVQGWYSVVLTGVAIAFSTQVFHQVVTNYAPALGDFLTSLKTGTSIPASVSKGG